MSTFEKNVAAEGSARVCEAKAVNMSDLEGSGEVLTLGIRVVLELDA